MKEDDVKVVMRQLLLAVDFLHKRNIVHRDLKMDNILINEIKDLKLLSVRIADFGLATILPEDINKKIWYVCGTPTYIAPEVLRGTGYREKVDIFSLGGIFFNLLTGFYLFNIEDKSKVIKLNAYCDLSFLPSYLKTCSRSCKDLLVSMLKINPAHRPTA